MRRHGARLAHGNGLHAAGRVRRRVAGCGAGHPRRRRCAPRTTAGFELDVLPYVSGGYYVSGWIGHDRIRVRPVVTKTTLPSFVVQDGFKNADLDVYAVIVDYFPRGGFRGFWVGAGVEYWKNSIENESNGGTAKWNNTVATIGAGYVWKVAGNFYLNPWAAGHLVVGGATRGEVEREAGREDADQDEHDQPHALLAVVRAMGEADAGAGEDQHRPDPSGGGVSSTGGVQRRAASRNLSSPRGEQRRPTRSRRSGEIERTCPPGRPWPSRRRCRIPCAAQQDAGEPHPEDRADERVRAGGGQPEIPGAEVPQDRGESSESTITSPRAGPT